jgi:hypothetical protein
MELFEMTEDLLRLQECIMTSCALVLEQRLARDRYATEEQVEAASHEVVHKPAALLERVSEA